MTVKELISELEKIENKELDVYSIWNNGRLETMDVYFVESEIKYADGYGKYKGIIMYGQY